MLSPERNSVTNLQVVLLGIYLVGASLFGSELLADDFKLFLPYYDATDSLNPTDSNLRIHDAVTGQLLEEVEIGARVGPIDSCGSGSRVVVAARRERSVTLLSAEAPYEKLRQWAVGIRPDFIAASPDCQNIWIGSETANSVSVISVESGEVTRIVTGDQLFVLRSSGGGRYVLAYVLKGDNRTVYAFDATTRRQLFTYEPELVSFSSSPTAAFELDRTGKVLFMGEQHLLGRSLITRIDRIEIESGAIISSFSFPTHITMTGVHSGPGLYRLELSEDQLVLWAGTDTGIHRFDAEDLQEVSNFSASGNVFDFSNGSGAVTYRPFRVRSTRGRVLSIIDLNTGEVSTSIDLPPGGTNAVGNFLVRRGPESRPVGVPLTSRLVTLGLILVIGIIGVRFSRSRKKAPSKVWARL